MNKPTSVSVTAVPCGCGYLESAASNPDLPVRYDKEMNEYFVAHKLQSGAMVSMLLYHCPMCGGSAPESKRKTLFEVVSNKELRRLDSLIEKIKTVRDVENVLGKPDLDEPVDSFDEARSNLKSSERQPVRVLAYTRLSTTADVRFMVHADGSINKIVAAKYAVKR